MKRVSSIWIGLMVSAGVAFPQGAGKTKIEVVGLHVNKPNSKEDKELTGGMDFAAGTRVDLLLVLDEPGFIKIDDRKTKITRFSDDKGTDLLAKKAGGKETSFGDFGPIGSFPKVSKDLKACLFDIQARNVPAVGAKGILLEGTLAVVMGKGQEVAKQEKVELKKGTSLKVGAIGLLIESAGKPDFGDAATQITISTKDGAKVAKLRFLDSAGKEIESTAAGSNSMSSAGETSSSWSYDFKQDVKVATVEATLWKQVVTVEVPLKLAFSVGF